MRAWKWLGLAGLLGAAAVGIVAVKRHRTRAWTEYSSDELRDRLHARLADHQGASTTA